MKQNTKRIGLCDPSKVIQSTSKTRPPLQITNGLATRLTHKCPNGYVQEQATVLSATVARTLGEEILT